MKPLTAASPHALIMIGIPGAGKSTFATQFATTFQALILSSSTYERMYEIAPANAEKLSEEILTEFMKTTKTIVIDGGFNHKEKREAMVRRLVKAGYRPLIVWVQTDTAEAYRRASKPFPKGSGIQDAQFDILLDEFEPPGDREKIVVISGKHTYTSQLKIVLKQLAVADHSQPRVPLSPEQKNQAEQINVRNHSRNRGTFLR